LTVVSGVAGLMLPASSPAFSPLGTQKLLVVLIERQHTGCEPDIDGEPTCPRYTAAQWQTILQRQLNSWYGTESYNQTSWDVHVLADPRTTNGWWPAPHTQAQYAGHDNFYDSPSIGRDAGETIPTMAMADGSLTRGELLGTHRLLMIDNYHRRGGQTNGVGVPLTYFPQARIHGRTAPVPFTTTVSVTAEDSGDADALSVIRHELGHQLGEPDLYSMIPCPLMPTGSPPDTQTGDASDCVGPWDHMALDYAGDPGFGGYTRQLPGWLNPGGSGVQVLDSTFNGTVSLDPLETPTGGKLIIDIPDDPRAAGLGALFGFFGPYKGFMVECRRWRGDDYGLPSQGALVSYLDPSRGNDHPEDVARGKSQTVGDAILEYPGADYVNHVHHLTITYEGSTASGGCMVNVDRRLLTQPHYIPTVAPKEVLTHYVGSFGRARSFSAFVGTGVMVNGPADVPARTASAGTEGVPVQPFIKGKTATIRFSYANGGDATAKGGSATVSVTDPYKTSVCGSQPAGRLIGRVQLKSLAPGRSAVAKVSYRLRTNGPIGVTVRLAASGASPLQAGSTEQGVLGFGTSRLTAQGTARPIVSTFLAVSSSKCRTPSRVYLNSLVSPSGWKITADGLAQPIKPGQSRAIKVVIKPPPGAKPQALELPLAILGAANNPAPHGPGAAPYRIGEPDVVAGFDLLARLGARGRPLPSFVLAGPPPYPKLTSYPSKPPSQSPSTLTLACPKGGTKGTHVTVSGTLKPVDTGAQVTLSYNDLSTKQTIRHTVSTGINGAFTDRFTPPAGDYSVQATFAGDGADRPAKQDNCQFAIT
jgi:hypothetical protein